MDFSIFTNTLCAMQKTDMLNKIMTLLLIGLITNTSLAQIPDSSKVKKFTYTNNPNKGKVVGVTKSQLDAKAYYDSGFNLIENGEFNKAIKPLKKAIQIDSTGNCVTGQNGMAFSELGYAYGRLGEIEKAHDLLDKAIEINEFLSEAYLIKAVLFLQKKDSKNGLYYLDLLLTKVPDFATGYVQRGFLLDSIGESNKALSDFNTFLKLMEEQNQKSNDLIESRK